jgi:hypothetical protein
MLLSIHYPGAPPSHSTGHAAHKAYSYHRTPPPAMTVSHTPYTNPNISDPVLDTSSMASARYRIPSRYARTWIPRRIRLHLWSLCLRLNSFPGLDS